MLQGTVQGFNQYEIEKVIDQGGEGTVFLSIAKQYAIKVFNRPIGDRENEFIQQLIKCGNKFKHLVRIFDYIVKPQQAIVMELANGDLEQLIKSELFLKQNLNWKHKLFYQLVEGVLELDNIGYFHRDLKPKNILYFQQQMNIVLKIADYGIVKKIDDCKETQNTGTQYYQAPEQRMGISNKSVDIWSLGIIWLQMIGNEDINSLSKFKTMQQNEIDQKIQQKQVYLKKELLYILFQMLQLAPEKRINIQNLQVQLNNALEDNPQSKFPFQQKFHQPNFFEQLQEWQEDLNLQNELLNESDQIFSTEDLQNFKNYVQQEMDVLQNILNFQGFQKQFFNQSKFHKQRKFYTEKINDSLKQKSQDHIQLLNKLKMKLNDIQIKIVKFSDQKPSDEQIQQHFIKDQIIQFEQLIQNPQLVNSYQDFLTQKKRFQDSIVDLENQVNLLSQDINIIHKNVILDKGNTVFVQIKNTLEEDYNRLQQNQNLFQDIEQQYQILQNSLNELKNLIDQGYADLIRLNQLQKLNKPRKMLANDSVTFQEIIEAQENRIKNISDQILFCNDHLQSYHNLTNVQTSLVLLKKEIEENQSNLKAQFQSLEQSKSDIELKLFQSNFEQFCFKWKEKQKTMTEKTKYLVYLLRDSKCTLILKYLIIILKLHKLKRYKVKLVNDKNSQLNAIDSQINYFEKIMFEITNTQTNYEDNNIDIQIDKTDKQIASAMLEIKEKNENKLKLKFRQSDSFQILKDKIYSLEFHQGLVLQLLVDDYNVNF